MKLSRKSFGLFLIGLIVTAISATVFLSLRAEKQEYLEYQRRKIFLNIYKENCNSGNPGWNADFAIEENQTTLDVLEKANDLAVKGGGGPVFEISQTDNQMVITKILDLENAEGYKWEYFVNNELVHIAPDEFVINYDDTIDWCYLER